MTSPDHRSFVRVAAALVAWLLVIGDVLGFAHQAAEVHAVCAEHGKLVHAEAAADVPEVHTEAELWSAPGEPHDEHEVGDHCRSCAAAHDPMTVATMDAVPERITPVLGVEPRAPVVRELPRRALFRAAPKTSPPVV